MLNCTPNDLINFTPNANESLHASHQLMTLQKKNYSDTKNILSNLSLTQLCELADLAKKGNAGEKTGTIA